MSRIPMGGYILFYPIGWEVGEQSEYGWVRGYAANVDAYWVKLDDEGGAFDWISSSDIIEVIEVCNREISQD